VNSTAEDQLLDADERGEVADFRGYCYATIHPERQLQKSDEWFGVAGYGTVRESGRATTMNGKDRIQEIRMIPVRLFNK